VVLADNALSGTSVHVGDFHSARAKVCTASVWATDKHLSRILGLENTLSGGEKFGRSVAWHLM